MCFCKWASDFASYIFIHIHIQLYIFGRSQAYRNRHIHKHFRSIIHLCYVEIEKARGRDIESYYAWRDSRRTAFGDGIKYIAYNMYTYICLYINGKRGIKVEVIFTEIREQLEEYQNIELIHKGWQVHEHFVVRNRAVDVFCFLFFPFFNFSDSWAFFCICISEFAPNRNHSSHILASPTIHPLLALTVCGSSWLKRSLWARKMLQYLKTTVSFIRSMC